MDKTITAIIPVKGNSTRLPNKNILPFAESNLLIHKIRQLKQVEEITDIIVSSDSDEMLAMGEAEGVTAIKRPTNLFLSECFWSTSVMRCQMNISCGHVPHHRW